ncbi:MAG TPA: hypothetical protein VIP11_14945, partial [Gemmatimonadaceae bacterium]
MHGAKRGIRPHGAIRNIGTKYEANPVILASILARHHDTQKRRVGVENQPNDQVDVGPTRSRRGNTVAQLQLAAQRTAVDALRAAELNNAIARP